MYKKLTAIQNKLKVPKKKYSCYGGFNYRSCDDILEAIKPLLTKYELTQIIEDEIVMIGDRYYVKATVKLTDGINTITNTAYAREMQSKTKMDECQVTGTASSYARKYALNGLYAIDDNQDVDGMNHDNQTTDNPTAKMTVKKSEKVDVLSKGREFIAECDDLDTLKDVANKIKLNKTYTKADQQTLLKAVKNRVMLLKDNDEIIKIGQQMAEQVLVEAGGRDE